MFITLLLLPFGLYVSAQQQVTGVVADSATQEPLPMAAVTLMRGGKPVAFTNADDKGAFSIAVKAGDSLSVSFLGYRKHTVRVSPGQHVSIQMAPEAFELREVQVKSGRIAGLRDTISYDLSKFADKRDNSLKDVLKKLPGVDVDKNGKISFNGKDISRFTVEDLDLTGGRYDRLNETLKPEDVDRAEVIQHDQPVKALRDKVFTDDVAMNIKLKPGARDKWMATLRPAADVAFPLKGTEPMGGADVLQIGRKRQSLYDAEYDHSGRDLSRSNDVLAVGGTTGYGSGADVPQWLAQPDLAAPIDDDRLRFNRSYSLNVKHTAKTAKGSDRRITAGYAHSNEEQTTSNTSSYYLGGSVVETTDETDYSCIKRDNVYVDFTSTLNDEKVYGNEYFLAEATRREGVSHIEGTAQGIIAQTVKTPEMRLLNDFSRLFTLGDNTLTVRSTADFHYAPFSLNVDGTTEELKNLLWHTDNSAETVLPGRYFTQKYKVGFAIEHLNLRGRNTSVEVYATPEVEYRRGRLRLNLSVPVKWQRLTAQNRNLLYASPSLYLSLKTGMRSELTAWGGCAMKPGEWNNFALDEYAFDYRTTYATCGVVPVDRTLSAYITYDYKRPVKELFWSFTTSYSHTRSNLMTDMTIADGRYRYYVAERDNSRQSAFVKAQVSKGFFGLHLKTLLALQYAYSEGGLLSMSTITGYRAHTFTMSPEVTFSPSFGTFYYAGQFTVNGMGTDETAQNMLFCWRQNLSYTQTIGNVDITLSAVHYRNELQSAQTVNTLLADAGIVWRLKKVRLQAELRNIFNRRNYAVTYYGSASSSTTYYNMRPREIILSAQISL